MKRLATWSAAVMVAISLATPVVRADVKTTSKSTFSMEGVMGGVLRLFGGKAAKDGITSTTALKGNRKVTSNDTTGQIVDLSEQKVYDLDLKKKEYRVTTFAELRAAFEKAKADAEKQMKDAKPEEKAQIEDASRQFEVDLDVKETGQKKAIAGYDTREVVLTLTTRGKGQTLEAGGGMVLTNTMWLGPKVAALDELGEFDLKFIKAVYGEAFVGDMQQLAGIMAMYPSFKTMSEKMAAELSKLEGTPISTITTFETVKSAEQMKAEAAEQPAGRGATGMLARRMMGNRNAPQPRSKVLTTTTDLLSASTSVTDGDVAVPAGFKEKK